MASVYGGAHPLAMDAHSGNVRGSNTNALAPARVSTHTLPTHARATPTAKDKRSRGRDSLRFISLDSFSDVRGLLSVRQKERD